MVDTQTFAPPDDLVYQYLLEQAVAGRLPVFRTIVFPDALKRFDEQFRPDLSEAGREIVTAMVGRWRSGKGHTMWTYQRSDDILVSDDYFELAAIEKMRPQFIAVNMLGEPYGPHIIDKDGPFPAKKVMELLFGPQDTTR